ncbi:MAG TPA: SDR family NAD(P)-dependent oxidoreductase [Acidimicrobiales bacterium]|nr:SDR family NAD(P)-dependent oxidoreductase [Acidimicrobiales bacterium]
MLSRLSRTLEGRVALVTGAASGMGRATAFVLSDLGARVALLDRSASVGEAVSAIEADGGTAGGWELDVTDAEACASVVAAAARQLGPVDILVNNAGVSLPAPIDGPDFDAAWDATLAVNLTAYARMVRLCLADLTRAGEGRVVNVASTEGLGATGFISAYTASKHGVIGLTRSLAVELGRRGMTVNCVCPGPIHTGMTAIIPDEAKERFARRRVPLGRYGDPEEVAQAIAGLVLPAASYINGAVLAVDGGLTVQNT